MSSQQPQEPRWDSNQQRWYRFVWVQGKWQSEWLPINWVPPPGSRRDSVTGNSSLASSGRASSSAISGIPYGRPAFSTNVLPRGRGSRITGTYAGPSTLHYEPVDRSYYVRSRDFFFLGRVFSVIMNETAGANATLTAITDYNTSRSLNRVKYEDNFVYTNVRRFIVVRQRREFCYACPIFTYSGKATTKRGVVAQEHGIAYSWGQEPHLVAGETGITKESIAVVMTEEKDPLLPASRIYYGIHHPIQYNVKVKEIGYVSQDQLHTLLGNWAEEEGKDEGTKQSHQVTAHAESSDHMGSLRAVREDEAESEEDDEEEEEEEENSVEDPPTADYDRHFYHPNNNPYGYHPKIAPDCYHPEHNPYGYHRQSNPHGYHPASNPHSYHPNKNPYGYHPAKAPFCYHPSYSPFGYNATSNPLGYHPSVTPYNYHPQSNLEGFHAKYNPYGYHPQSNPHGYHPTLSPKGYHPKHHVEAYHPKYHPDGIYFGGKGKGVATSAPQHGSSAETASSSDEDEDDTDVRELSGTLSRTSISGTKGFSSTQAGAYQYSVSPPTAATSPRPYGRRSQDDTRRESNASRRSHDDDTGKGKQRRR